MNKSLSSGSIRAQELRQNYKDFLEAEADVDFRLAQEQKRVRIVRALSWLQASDDAVAKIESGAISKKEGVDQSFMFLWISFNAAYGYDPNVLEPGETWQERNEARKKEENKERKIINRFIRQIKAIDDSADAALTTLVKSHGLVFGGLLRNPFMYRDFWHWVRNSRRRKAKDFSPSKWKSSENGIAFAEENKPLNRIKNKDKFLFVVFDRLHTLRNQMIHGGATYGPGSLNLSSVESGQQVLALLVPTILKIMLDAPLETKWRAISYPRIRQRPDGGDEDWLDDNRVTDSKD